MKKLIFFLFVSLGLNAQFNYQAIVKDAGGEVMTNTQVKLKFSLMQASSTSDPVYVEEHTLTTPYDGVVNLSVGGGTVSSGSFSDIDWGQQVFLKQELDTGNGYEDMGTRPLASVPVAEFAKFTKGFKVDAANNISVGESSMGQVSSTGNLNVAVGWRTLENNGGGSSNVAVGERSMMGGDGNQQIVNATGSWNTAVGAATLMMNTNGNENAAFGAGAMENSTSGSENVAIGYQALSSNDGGFMNTAVGSRAMHNRNTSGYWNTAVGTQSLKNNETGTENVALGAGAMYSPRGSNFTTAVGVLAGNTPSSTLNTFIGYHASGWGELTNSTAIGANAQITASNMIQLGNASVTLVNTSGVVAAADFVIDGTSIVNSISATGLVDTNENIKIGDRVLSNIISATHNIGIGNDALSSNVSGTYNVALGIDALRNNTASRNTALGSLALKDNTTGTTNTAVGFYSLVHNQTGNRNVGLGDAASYYNIDGDYNVALGTIALLHNVSGSSNVAVGDAALYNSISSSNVAVGDGAGYDLTTDNSDFNTFVGAGANTVSGTTITNATALGSNAQVTTSHSIQLGNSDVNLINTSAVVSATGFRGNADEVTLTYSGTIMNILDIMNDLRSEIDNLKQIINGIYNAIASTAAVAFETYFDLETGTICNNCDFGATAQYDLIFAAGSGDVRARMWWNSQYANMALVDDKTFEQITYLDLSNYYFCQHINDTNSACANTDTPPTDFVGIFQTSEGNYFAVEYITEDSSNVSFRYKWLSAN